jgi:hypothetical protein
MKPGICPAAKISPAIVSNRRTVTIVRYIASNVFLSEGMCFSLIVQRFSTKAPVAHLFQYMFT